MRRRINRTLLAATAASVSFIGLGFMAAGAAGAATSSGAIAPTSNAPSGGAPINTCAQPVTPGPLACAAGYQASGRDFRYAQALITIPNRAPLASDPDLYVGLDGSTANSWDYARAGIYPNGGVWSAFIQVEEPTLTAGLDVGYTLPPSMDGDGVLFSVYLNASGNSVHFVITLPNGTVYYKNVAVNGPVYTAAQALGDWTSHPATPTTPAAPTANTRVTQFLQGRFTTLNGARGTFEGPWSLNPVEATSNGDAYPRGTLIGAPTYLWNDGTSPQGTDAFGLWLYSS
jgi:hypothetical protein